MPAVHFALIRHGDFVQPDGVPSAHLPHPLTELGRSQAVKQARTLAEHIREHDYELDPVIDSSSLLRAYQTAQIFAEHLSAELGPMRVEEYPSLSERCLGSAANLSLAEIDEVVAKDPRLSPLPPGWKAQTDFRLPLLGAESLFEAGQRIADHLRPLAQELSKEEPGTGKKLKLIVGHGGAFRHGALHLGVLTREQIPRLSMYHCEPVILAFRPESNQESWTHVGGKWKVRSNAPSDDV